MQKPFPLVKYGSSLFFDPSLPPFGMSVMLRYSLKPDTASHLYRMSLTLDAPASVTTFYMPAWTSGSYLIRDYAGRIRGPRCSRGILTQISTNRWTLSGVDSGSSVTLEWEVFAFSLGIHDAWLDADRGFFNPAAVFILPEGLSDVAARLSIESDDIKAFCSLPETSPGVFSARTLDELLDAPMTLIPPGASVQTMSLTVQSIPHTIVLTGVGPVHRTRLLQDIGAILETALQFWGSAPFDRYVFHIHCGPNLFGGLEHEASCVLQKDAGALPGPMEDSTPEDYDDFLRLLAHEYFHAWLVKYLRPAALLPYSLDAAAHTPDLWVFEGLTSYYENLIPYRAGVIGRDTFFKRLNERFRAVREKEGFFRESLSDAGFNAWTHLYKQTADSAYSQSSYYGKGAVLAFITDILLRARIPGMSLDTVLRSWYESARTDASRRALPAKGFPDLLTDVSLRETVAQLADTAGRDIWQRAWSEALDAAGLTEDVPDPSDVRDKAGLFVRIDADRVFVRHTPSGSPAFKAGLFAGDEIVAVDGVRTTAASFERQIGQASGRAAEIAFFRQHRLMRTNLTVKSRAEPAVGPIRPEDLTPTGKAWLSTAS